MLLSAVSLLGLQALVMLAPIFRYSKDTRCQRPKSDAEQPHVVVILPCKGIDSSLEATVRMLFQQSYRNYSLLFVTESCDDPAYRLINTLIRGSAPKAKLISAGLATDCGQKIHNLSTAVDATEHLFPKTEIIAFCDSDVKLRQDWLECLVAPLGDRAVGVSTGYRWYMPRGSNVGSLLLSAWNAQGLFLFGDRSSFAWGGSMAIRRCDFQKWGIRRIWRGSVSDDGGVTSAVRLDGRRIQFVPRCLVVSYADATLAEVIEFTNRQNILTRVYMPNVWYQTLAVTAYFCILSAVALSAIYRLILERDFVDLSDLLLLTGMLAIMTLQAWLQIRFARKSLSEYDRDLKTLWPKFVLLMPLGVLLTICNVAVSSCSRRIVWRGVGYTLISPNETIVSRKHGS
jgi:ceramide glucosyltransferase